jgi:2-polyprenyl-6-methoxyphenol hydroxylase-like FAD-dependent oxidoreductase
MLVGGGALGLRFASSGPGISGPGSGTSDDLPFWILIVLLAIRAAVRVMSLESPQSALATISADLMLLSVGMAATRLVLVWRRRRGQGAHRASSLPPAQHVEPQRQGSARRSRAGARRGLRVIVIGGGIGGLCLAHGLRGAEIEVAVYERSDARPRASWQQGYQIHINSIGSAALEECLPSDTFALFKARALRPRDGVQVLDGQLTPLMALAPRAIEGSNPIERTALRDVLLTGLDGVVVFRRAFARYESDASGIRAIFDDGSAAFCDVLVGADGVGSKVRAQYLPEATVEDIGLVGMAGKLPLTEALRVSLPTSLLTHLTSIRAPHGLYMIVTQSIHKGRADGVAADRAAMSPVAADDDHLIWVLVSARDVYGADAAKLFHDGSALRDLARRLTSDWHPTLQRMVADTDAGVVSATALRAARDVQPWATTNVTLLGDAIHAMPPLQGQGGSTALRDAALLARKLASADRREMPLLDAINEYESAMLVYGFDAVHAAKRMASMIARGEQLDGSFARFREPDGRGRSIGTS